MIGQAALGAIALGIVFASTSSDAQTVRHRAKPAPVGRQIIVREAVPRWLTMGTWAPVGSRNGYALDTLRPPLERNTVQGTFVGMRGNDRLPNDIRLPEANRPLITVAWPGYPGPLLDLY